MKKLLSTLLVCALLLSSLGSLALAAEGEAAKAALDLSRLDSGVGLLLGSPYAYADKQITMVDADNAGVTPALVGERTLVPVRFISEKFGAQVEWIEEDETVILRTPESVVTLQLGSDRMYVNDTEIRLDVAAQTIQDRTMLPLRALCEQALGKNVFWDERGLILLTNLDTVLDAARDAVLVDAMLTYLQVGAVSPYHPAPKFTEAIYEDAYQAEPVFFGTDSNYGNSNQQVKGIKAMYYLSLAAYFDAQAQSSEGVLAKDRVLEHIRNLISGGKEVYAVSGPHWAVAELATTIQLMKHVPAIWDELKPEEIEKIDLMMKAMVICVNWGYNDENNFTTPTNLKRAFGKDYNPNYRCSFLPVLPAAVDYFGSAAAVDEILTSFSYDEYMAKFEEFGFTNLIEGWSPAGKELMENGGKATIKDGSDGGSGVGVKLPFRYKGMGLDNVDGIMQNLIEYTYGEKVINYFGTLGADNYCYIISDVDSPFTGQKGMMTEFKSADSKGIRSDAAYCYDSAMNIIPYYLNAKLLGNWDSNSEAQKNMDSLIFVGTEDLIFKLSQGYHSYSMATAKEHYESTMEPKGYAIDKEIWRKVLNFSSEDTTIVTVQQ